jgi:hypothetical protein
VPIEIAHALENAVETHYDRRENKDGAMTMDKREALSYPFSVLAEK